MMSSDCFGISGQDAPAISEKIVAGTLNAIQQLLPENKIQQFCAEVQYPWRDRILSPAVTVLHMILAALWPEESFNASWQVQWAGVASRYPELDLSLSGSLPTDDRTSLVLFYALNYARDMDAAIDDLLKERASTGIPYLGKTIVTPDNSMAKLDSTSLWVRGGHAIAQLHLTSARDFRGPVQLAVQIRNRPDKDGLCAPRSRVFTQMVWPGH